MFTKLNRATRCALMGVACLVLSVTSVFAQNVRVSGTVTDRSGEPLGGTYVVVEGSSTGTTTDADGKYSLMAPAGGNLVFSLIGMQNLVVPINDRSVIDVALDEDALLLDDVVVTALGIKRERKSLGYAVTDLKADELMKNKTANPVSSLSGKIAGVSVTQTSGGAGSGAQIILRGGTSAAEGKDNQPLFVVDGIVYDNTAQTIGDSAFDGSGRMGTETNRVMDINPEDIEDMSILKGAAAAALYGSRAANGVVLITTKSGKEGRAEVNFNSKFTTSWVTNLPQTQREYTRGYLTENRDSDGNIIGIVFDDFSYNSWGEKSTAQTYDNIGNFFQGGYIFDENLSVAGGTENSKYYLSASYYDQTGVVPETGYTKYTIRFNGEQKYGIFTFGANVAYTEAHTDRTLTSGGLYDSSGTGSLYAAYTWSPFDDMRHYLNEDGSRYRLFGDKLEPWSERDNPYWIINNNKVYDDTRRWTGNVNVKADILKNLYVQYRVGLDTYSQTNCNRIAPDGVVKEIWQQGMMSDNEYDYRYITHNLMLNFNSTMGKFTSNTLAGLTTEDTQTTRDYKMAYKFTVPNFFSYANASDDNKAFSHSSTQKRLVGAYYEWRLSYDDMAYLTITGRNDWTSTLPKENRSYFYPSFSGAFIFTELLQRKGILDDSILSFGKIRASWARVGKDTGAYETATVLWPVGTYLNGLTGVGNYWERGNPYLKPEMTESAELGIELGFFNNRLHIDYAYYTNNSYNQILSPRGPQSTGYIFCSINAGNVLNHGMELEISGTPIETRDLRWDVSLNIYGNRGKLTGLPDGTDVMYLTSVQYAGAQAASFNDGHFMAIAGKKWRRDDDGNVILDSNGMPTYTTDLQEVGNREAKFQGGINNTITWKNFSFNMLWEFRHGGDVLNGTQYVMDNAGTSKFSGEFRDKPLTISGVDADGNPVTNTWNANDYYMFNGVQTLGYNIIESYYTGYYPQETANYLTSVNLLRLRALSLTYNVPKSFLNKLGTKNGSSVIKAASISLAATNVWLITNYDGDPEAAVAGAGVGGSSSVGFDYCGVPSTTGMTFGINLKF